MDHTLIKEHLGRGHAVSKSGAVGRVFPETSGQVSVERLILDLSEAQGVSIISAQMP